jgi:hypothetical protein
MMWSCRYLFNGLLDDVDIKEDQPLSKGPSESLLRFGSAAQRLLVTDEKGEFINVVEPFTVMDRRLRR